MHRIPAAAGLLAALVSAQDQVPKRPSPEEALRSELASPFLHHADWTLDYEAALEKANREGKLVLGYFTTANY